mmetsp:Transcript_42450/g.110053  ORF Transcript_42450/g.110053 Transcript_42450/m.110053 type:complete len:226 (-) Transcript_42450:259-936(-)
MGLGRASILVPAVVLFILLDGTLGNVIDTEQAPENNVTHPADRLALHRLLAHWDSQRIPSGESWGVAGEQRLDWDLKVDPCGSASCSASVHAQRRCNWEGLHCEGYRVHAIVLPARELQGSFETHLCRLRELRRLDLSGNLFSGQPPLHGCDAMPNLTAMDISNNRFEGEVPFADTALPRLVLLNISSNNFDERFPINWGRKMEALEVLTWRTTTSRGSYQNHCQ